MGKRDSRIVQQSIEQRTRIMPTGFLEHANITVSDPDRSSALLQQLCRSERTHATIQSSLLPGFTWTLSGWLRVLSLARRRRSTGSNVPAALQSDAGRVIEMSRGYFDLSPTVFTASTR